MEVPQFLYTIMKSAENYKYQAIYDLVNRLQVVSLSGYDKVTFIMNRISGLTCKVQNLVSYNIRNFIQMKMKLPISKVRRSAMIGERKSPHKGTQEEEIGWVV